MKIGGVLVELPPRARRIQQLINIPTYFLGTTSACAENTTAYKYPHLLPGNYLRVRGEYFVRFCPTQATVELPPRARRIHWGDDRDEVIEGTTSACAENTNRHHF